MIWYLAKDVYHKKYEKVQFIAAFNSVFNLILAILLWFSFIKNDTQHWNRKAQ